MEKVKGYIYKFENLIASIMLLILLSVSFLQIIERKLLEISIVGPGSQEIIRYSFIYLVYIGISMAVYHQEHVKTSFFLNILPDKIKRIIELFSQIVFLCFCIVMFYESTRLVIFSYQMKDLTPVTGINMYLIFLALPLSFALSSFHLILIIFEKIVIFQKNLLETSSYDKKNI